MQLVVDASVAASWAFDDEDEPVANLAPWQIERRSGMLGWSRFMK
jgi:hypothetical protein